MDALSCFIAQRYIGTPIEVQLDTGVIGVHSDGFLKCCIHHIGVLTYIIWRTNLMLMVYVRNKTLLVEHIKPKSIVCM